MRRLNVTARIEPQIIGPPPASWYGQTALQAACEEGHIAIIAKLLVAGADVNARGGNNKPRT